METFTVYRRYREMYDTVSRLLLGLSATTRPVVLPKPFRLEADSGLFSNGVVIDSVSVGKACGITLSGKGTDGSTVVIGSDDYLCPDLFPDVFDAVYDELVSQLESLRRVWVVRTLSDENYGNEIKHIPRVLWKQDIVPGFHDDRTEAKRAMYSAVFEHASSALPHVEVKTEYEPDGSIRYLVDSDHTGIPKKVYWTDYEIVGKEPKIK
jgi:hypothetical protein